MGDASLVPSETIQSKILALRGVRVLLDRDLALLYGVTTKRLNEQVRRNIRKFPKDFMFELTTDEVAQVLASSICPTPSPSTAPFRPPTFSAAITATEMGGQVVRTFVRRRQLFVNHKTLATTLAELDARGGAHDEQLAAIIDAIRRPTGPALRSPNPTSP